MTPVRRSEAVPPLTHKAMRVPCLAPPDDWASPWPAGTDRAAGGGKGGALVQEEWSFNDITEGLDVCDADGDGGRDRLRGRGRDQVGLPRARQPLLRAVERHPDARRGLPGAEPVEGRAGGVEEQAE